MTSLTLPVITALDQGAPDDYEPYSPEELKEIARLVTTEFLMGPRLATAAEMRKSFEEHGDIPFIVQVLLKRLEVFAPTAVFSEWVVIYVSLLCDRAGLAVMWAYMLYRHNVSLTELFNTTPLGENKPTEAFQRFCWRSQKRDNRDGGTDNWLDYPEAWA